MRQMYITAYQWLYGATKREAEKAWRRSDDERRSIVIKCFTDNAKKTFTED